MTGLLARAGALLLPLARRAGAGLLARWIERDNPPVLEAVVTGVAERLGVEPTPEAIVAAPADDVDQALRDVEDSRPAEAWARLAAGELEAKRELLAREDERESWFAWAWRPFWMWLLGILWTWALLVGPIVRALWLPDLVPADLAVLLPVTALFLALYMGGHTVKAVAETRWGGK